MYHHVKKLMYTVNVGEANPKFGRMLLEQFGGANGELAAAMQYSVQGINCEDARLKDVLMDIGTEELSHLEIIGTLARMHLTTLDGQLKAILDQKDLKLDDYSRAHLLDSQKRIHQILNAQLILQSVD